MTLRLNRRVTTGRLDSNIKLPPETLSPAAMIMMTVTAHGSTEFSGGAQPAGVSGPGGRATQWPGQLSSCRNSA